MKYLKAFLAFVLTIPLVFLTVAPGSWAAQIPRIVEYVDSPLPVYNPGIVDEILDSAGSVNELLISFWTQNAGPQGAALEWALGTFGDTQQAVDRFHSAGIDVLIAVGGAFESPVTSNPEDGYYYGVEAAHFALDNNFDGIDFDIENIVPGNPDVTSEWLALATVGAKDVYPNAIISHAPQAPYFSPAQNYGYLEVNDKVGDLIDSYNIQFYNQMSTAYDNLEELFFDSGFNQPETAVAQINANGVPLEKIVIGKPITEDDVFPGNTGYVPPYDLDDIICDGVYAGLSVGGVMGWQWSSDYKEQQAGAPSWSEAVSYCLQ